MTDNKDPDRRYNFSIGPDGEAILERLPPEEPEPEPTPAEDGKYYLKETRRAHMTAQALADGGIKPYCAECKAPLFVSRVAVYCTGNRQHFEVHINYRPPVPKASP